MKQKTYDALSIMLMAGFLSILSIAMTAAASSGRFKADRREDGKWNGCKCPCHCLQYQREIK